MAKLAKEKCISCLACVSACPEGVIRVEGLHISINDTGQCTSCDKKLCKIMCPTGAISVG